MPVVIILLVLGCSVFLFQYLKDKQEKPETVASLKNKIHQIDKQEIPWRAYLLGVLQGELSSPGEKEIPTQISASDINGRVMWHNYDYTVPKTDSIRRLLTMNSLLMDLRRLGTPDSSIEKNLKEYKEAIQVEILHLSADIHKLKEESSLLRLRLANLLLSELNKSIDCRIGSD